MFDILISLVVNVVSIITGTYIYERWFKYKK